MASGGSGKRPPRTPIRPNGHNLRGAEHRPRPGKAPSKPPKATGASAGGIFWRRLRQRVRSLWRWMVVRNVRTLVNRLTGNAEGIRQTNSGGDVRQFPGGK
jgi:hypothetical protein